MEVTIEELNSLNDQFTIVNEIPVKHNRDFMLDIKCNKCGQIFKKSIWNFKRSHKSCPLCETAKAHTRKTTEQFIEEAKKVHGDKYDYSLIDYKNNKIKVKIICPIHGVFEQIPKDHLNGHNCPVCVGGIEDTTETFIIKSKTLHGDSFDYSKVKYINTWTPVILYCNKCNRDFQIEPNRHINALIGCPYCHGSRGEREIRSILEDKNIEFEEQKTFPDCKDQLPLSYDFYIPSTNTLIEYQGEQHYKKVYYGGEEHRSTDLEAQKKHDQIKKEYAENNGYNLIVIPYTDLGKIKNKYFS